LLLLLLFLPTFFSTCPKKAQYCLSACRVFMTGDRSYRATKDASRVRSWVSLYFSSGSKGLFVFTYIYIYTLFFFEGECIFCSLHAFGEC
jgi:hypothetical protein